LHFDLQDFWEITDENIEQVRQKYYELTKEIETKKAEYALGDNEAFPMNETSNCKFCDYKELCPLFTHFYGKIEDFELSEDTIKSMIDEYVKLSKQKTNIEKQMKQNKEILEKYAKRNDFKKLYGNEYTISISSLKNFKVLDKEKLKQYLEEKDIYVKTSALFCLKRIAYKQMLDKIFNSIFIEKDKFIREEIKKVFLFLLNKVIHK